MVLAGKEQSPPPNEAGSAARRLRAAARRYIADAHRKVKARRVGLAELVGQEVGGLQVFVVLRLNPVEAHAVVQREAAGDLPVVLGEKLDVVVAVLADVIAGSLVELVVDADGGVGEAEARVQRVGSVIHEIVLAVVVGEGALRLEAVLPEDAELQGVLRGDLGDGARPIAVGVEVIERRVVGPDIRAIGDAPAVEDELGRGIDLHRTGIDHRNAR